MRRWLAFQVGCTYIGTVVGAGFASGQEVYQFFGRFGWAGFAGVVLSTALLGWAGYQVMRLGQRTGAASFRDVTRLMFGPRVAAWIDLLMLWMMFGVSVAMLAGAGELLRERLGWPYAVGAGLTMIVTFVTVTSGMNGILRANTVIVPLMIGFVGAAGMYTALRNGLTQAALYAGHVSSGLVYALVSAVVYSALNVGLSIGVLVPLGAKVKDERTLVKGALFGAGGLGGMLVILLGALYAHAPDALQYQVPMGFISSQMSSWFRWAFLLILWAEIYSTLAGDVYGLSAPFHRLGAKGQTLLCAAVLVGAFFLGQLGFSTIIHYGYRLFGWISLFLLLTLLWPYRHLPRA